MPTAVATAAAVAYSLFLSLASSALRPQTAADAAVPTAVATAATAAVANSLSLTQLLMLQFLQLLLLQLLFLSYSLTSPKLRPQAQVSGSLSNQIPNLINSIVTPGKHLGI